MSLYGFDGGVCKAIVLGLDDLLEFFEPELLLNRTFRLKDSLLIFSILSVISHRQPTTGTMLNGVMAEFKIKIQI
jgi:hypothetical protein